PVSEVRDTSQHTLPRTSETKGHWQAYDSSAAFRFEVPNRICCNWCRNFKSAALPRRTPITANKKLRNVMLRLSHPLPSSLTLGVISLFALAPAHAAYPE